MQMFMFVMDLQHKFDLTMPTDGNIGCNHAEDLL